MLRYFAWIVLCSAVLAGKVRAESKISISIDVKVPGTPIPADFCGLSFETSNVSPGLDGRYLFDAQNAALVRIFRTLGIRNLRIGGAMADRPGVAIPGTADIDRLFGFASAADVRVIYTLRLREGNAKKNAAIAKYIFEHYREHLAYFAIGNEPNFYIHDYAEYRREWEEMVKAILAVALTAKFCGPSSLDKNGWASEFARDFASSGYLDCITEHAYVGGDARKFAARNDEGAAARDAMLSPAWLDRYDKLFKSFGPDASSRGLHFRLEETNNYSEGGVDGASDAFAAALWSLDYLHWWAAHGAAGVNFHNRRWIRNCVIYPATHPTTRATTPTEFDLHPIAFGIKAFDLGGHGIALPIRIDNPDGVNLTAYAARDGNRLLVTAINKDPAKAADVMIAVNGSGNAADAMSLVAAQNDASAKTDITLGGSEVERNGIWDGKWSHVEGDKSGAHRVDVPPTSAIVLKIPVSD